MYISGLPVQKKHPHPKLSITTTAISNPIQSKPQPIKPRINVNINSDSKQEYPYNQQSMQRPSSSSQIKDLKQLQCKNHYSIGAYEKKAGDIRHLSQNKISIKTNNKKISQKKLGGRSGGEGSTGFIRVGGEKEKDRDRDRERDRQQKQKGNFALNIKPKLNKRPVSDATTSNSTIRLNPQQLVKIQYYFRYLPVSIYTSINLRQPFMKTLAQQQQITPINPYKKPSTKASSKINITQHLQKLNKQAQLKAKYKYREKFNYAYSAQLKALEYKRRQFKKKKEESSSTESDQQKQEKCRDMDTWKRSMGIDGKVFIIKGKYPDLRQALLSRGWVQNTDKKSTFYDLRWTTKISDINFGNLKSNQIVNHFDNNACLTSKYGLIKSIRSVMYPQSMDIDRFFAKAYDLSDLSDFQNFIEMFKWIYCQSLIKRAYQKIQQIPLQKIKLSIIVTQRRLTALPTLLQATSLQQYPFCSINQWNYLTDKACNFDQITKTIDSAMCGDNMEGILGNLLTRLQEAEPQFKLNGWRNIWIVKPAFLSRGRGIRCLTNLNDILDTCLGKETQYVVQKYIQNPLIINKRKFDIRVWVVIQDYNPPKIWFYNQFYLRFCLQDYNTETLKNRYAHLTNNSVQKYNSKIGSTDLDSSMWDRQTFQKWVCENYGQDKFKILLGKMKEIVIATVLGTLDQVSGRKGSFEQIGYDMMIDQDLNPWLIQVNSSPAMDYSTPITRKLVKMVMEDIAKIVVDLRKKKNAKVKNAGQFKCIYSGVQSFKNKYYRIGATNQKNDQ